MYKRSLPVEDPPQAKKLRMQDGSVANGASKAGDGLVIDEDLHSRQLAVYGRESMRRMAASNVLIVGALGLGVEIAKNVILAGVKSVTVHDAADTGIQDLSAQFYLSKGDVGRNRAEACRDKLQELNTAVAVSASSVELKEDFLSQFQVVVATNVPLEKALALNDFCHRSGIAFIRADVRGVFASVFTDFGASFTVVDVDGEDPATGIVAGITTNPDGSALVTCVEDERLEFQDGMQVTFSEVIGMEELNDGKPRKVKKCKAHSFELEEDTSAYSPYVRGGIVTQHKASKTLSFKSLEEALATPGEFLFSDFSKLERPALLHLGFQALDAFQAEFGRLPAPHNEEDATKFVSIAKKLNETAADKAEIDEAVLKALSYTASGELSPMAAFFGGVVGQEVMKAVSGKFHPIFQWFYFDSMESLPENLPLPPNEVDLQGSRYDGQIAVFGKTVQQKLEQLRTFLVGAGALGCEFIKNFAMMGVATDNAGLITLTDDDTIEKSNLSRQFLFRDWNIGSAKSTVASAAAQDINPALKVRALQNRVSPDTEDVFDDTFWANLDVVVNALDNVNARLYVDSRCVYFCKPLLESGTLGPKCNTQMVIPRMTENYGASRDPPEKQAPMCTLHSFPHNIDHCLTYARSEFEGMLEKSPTEANAFLTDPAKYLAAVRQASDSAAREQLEKVVDVLETERCVTFDDCIAWARRNFQSQFHDRIAQLVYTFPEDAVTSTGTLFWSAPKRFPRAVNFDAADPTHAAYAQSAAILRAEVYGIALPPWATSAEKVAQAAAKVHIPEFVPKKGVQIETDPKASSVSKATALGDDEGAINALIEKLEATAKELPPGYKLNPITFEKDDDTNYHMDLIASLANMRARNYSIPEVDKLKAKLIAGKIIPAIATATALATGLVCLELYKVVQDVPLEKYRNTFANLALPLFAMSEPVASKTVKFQDLEWSLWDRWILEGDLTVQQVLDWFKKRGLEAYSISCGQSLLYNNIFPKHKERLGKPMSELVRTVAKMDIPPKRNHFDVVVACEDDEGEDLDVPLVSIKFR
ncbi:Ubiquitin-activating enzyme E1 1 [Coccomyxa sp. Obi]|nr:Ubiquitin-activating enzyme E1 1 [Coccomyxa sp. Obi]